MKSVAVETDAVFVRMQTVRTTNNASLYEMSKHTAKIGKRKSNRRGERNKQSSPKKNSFTIYTLYLHI